MKRMKKTLSLMLSAAFAAGMVSSACAEPGNAPQSPHLIYETEKLYGEDYSVKPLHRGGVDDDFADVGDHYVVLPKTDSFSFENSLANAEVRWWCVEPTACEDGVGLFWEGAPARTEKYEAGKEYPVFSQDLQETVASLSQGSGWYPGYYHNEGFTPDAPFFIIEVMDYDADFAWRWAYQVTDDWTAPSASETPAKVGAWMQDEHGWWIQYQDGTYLTNDWYQSPAGLWYYMGADGYMLTDTVTPDGYTVNADGVWVQ